MTITTTNNRMDYVGNDSTAVYDYTYKIFLESELTVKVRNTTTDVESTLVLNTDYSVSGVGSRTGGSITLIDAGQAWISGTSNLNTGYNLVILREVAVTQQTDIRNQGDFYPESHEDVFDKLTMIDQQQDEKANRAVTLPDTVAPSAFDPTLPTDIETASVSVVTNATGNGWEVGPTVDEISNAQTYANQASTSKDLAQSWATETTALVESIDNSAKAWSIGGTGAGQPSAGDAKSWATEVSSTVNGAEYSSKEYAQGTQAGTGGSAKDWAQKTSAVVTGTLYSSKEWATGIQTRGAASGGSSKDWSTYTSGTVDNAEYSSKEYAQGTQAGTGGSAKDWAMKTSAAVTGSLYSAKEWALGTQTRGVASSGSAKDWATYTSGTVDDTEYSSKEWATGTQTRGVASGGSAKDWATYTGGTVDGTGYSAQYHANQAALNQAASIWSSVVNVAVGDSPVTVTDANVGTLYVVDASGGAVTFNLPAISTLTGAIPWSIGIKKNDSSANAITINRGGTDTIDGGTSVTINTPNLAYNLVPGGTEWNVLYFSEGTGGGGGSSLTWKSTTGLGPFEEQSEGIEILTYGDGLSQEIYGLLTVPETYTAGVQIKLVSGTLAVNDTSTTALMSCDTKLVKAGTTVLGALGNAHTSTNSAVTLDAAIANEITSIGDVDLTDGSGQIDSVAVSPGDQLLIRLFRGTDTSTADIKVLRNSFVPKFTA